MTLTRADIGWRHESDPGEPTTGKPRLSISDNEATILSALALERTVLEIGTGLGVSTRALAWRAKTVTTIDVDEWVRDSIAPELAKLLNVTCLSERPAVPPSVDLVFIDADHSTEAVANDIAYARRAIFETRGLIVCHDARYPNVQVAFPEDHLYIDTEHGLAVFA